MQLLTPFDFVAMFPEGGSVAVVGNSGFLAAHSYGALIDSHDVVVRFNDCALDGYERQVGARTDILICNPYAETRQRQCLDGRRAKCVIGLFALTRRGEVAAFADWIGDQPVLCSYNPDILPASGIPHHSGLTTGVYGLYLVQRILKPSRMLVTGFSMFSVDYPPHYWTTVMPGGVKAHDFDEVARALHAVIMGAKCEVSITAEVASAMERFGRLKRRIQTV